MAKAETAASEIIAMLEAREKIAHDALMNSQAAKINSILLNSLSAAWAEASNAAELARRIAAGLPL